GLPIPALPPEPPEAPAEEAAEPSRPPLKRALIASAAWNMAGWAAERAVSFAVGVAFTYLLVQDAVGLMDVVWVFIIGLHLFSDIGIGPSVVHHRRGEDPTFYNTAWTIQVIRGLTLWLASALIAGPVAWLYDEPGLPSLLWLLPAVGMATAISGFN